MATKNRAEQEAKTKHIHGLYVKPGHGLYVVSGIGREEKMLIRTATQSRLCSYKSKIYT